MYNPTITLTLHYKDFINYNNFIKSEQEYRKNQIQQTEALRQSLYDERMMFDATLEKERMQMIKDWNNMSFFEKIFK